MILVFRKNVKKLIWCYFIYVYEVKLRLLPDCTTAIAWRHQLSATQRWTYHVKCPYPKTQRANLPDFLRTGLLVLRVKQQSCCKYNFLSRRFDSTRELNPDQPKAVQLEQSLFKMFQLNGLK